ncbi:MAG: N-acyl homoserine lactonase family protein [Nitrososphaerota archaeon]|nr:N-acyl homoserine lactonase family protein [Nitrososphaerota archaeon]
MGTKIYLIDGGQFQQDQSIVTFARGAGQRVWSQVYAVYVDHPEAKIMIETGMDTNVWPSRLVERFAPKQSEEQKVENALRRLGVNPDEIDIIINTHLHADHCRSNHIFKNATWLVNREELREALAPEPFEGTYIRACFDAGVKTQMIFDDYSVVKGVDILSTPGHTVGHNSIAVETENSGVFLFTGDASMTKENFWGSERTSPYGWPCGPCINQKQYMRSLERMREFLKSTKARTLKTCTPMYSHDPDEFSKWRHSPNAYE